MIIGTATRLLLAVIPWTPRVDSVPALARFLDGHWHCRGGTPAGRVMEADVTFRFALGGKWLTSEHVDVPPARYLSMAYWAADTSAKPITTAIYDNFGGARRFFGQWTADSIAWQRDTTEAGARFETFTYRRSGPDSYWYAWHVDRSDGRGVALGDSATCRRSG